MSGLTIAKIEEMMRGLPRQEPDLLSPFRLRPLGRQIYEEPPPPPRIQVRDIKFKDGTSILPKQFLARENAWWAERFGLRDPLCGPDKVYFLGNYGILCSPMNAHVIRNSWL